MMFNELGLNEPIARAVAAEGYRVPTPIQIKAIPPALAGSDVLGCAQTGTGKTAAFAIPVLQRLAATLHAGHADQNHSRGHGPQNDRSVGSVGSARNGHQRSRHTGRAGHPPRALVLAPTRELASQILESFRTYGKHLQLRHAVIFGGVGQFQQVRSLRNGVDVLVATPGRLLDLMGQGYVDLSAIEVLVLDEADRMLDMGFIHDIRKIAAQIPTKRQTLFFSATMPGEIRRLADSMLHEPVFVQVDPVASTVDAITQSVYFVTKKNKPILLERLLRRHAMERTLVFARTKHGADRVVKSLRGAGLKAEAIHGNKSQNARTAALDGFKSGSIPILVATDIASRGIDVDEITHVVNFDLPNVAETYVHRIGRTARAGAKGEAVSFCDHEEIGDLRDIERLIKKQIEVVRDEPDLVYDATAFVPQRTGKSFSRGGSTNGSRSFSSTGSGGGNRRRRTGAGGGGGNNGGSAGRPALHGARGRNTSRTIRPGSR